MNTMMVKIKSWRVCSKLDNDKNLFAILSEWMVSFENFSDEEIEERIKEFVEKDLESYSIDERLRLKSKIEHYFF